MIYIVEKNPRTLEAVHTHTHTHGNLKKKKIYINKKGNIILPCGFFDTG